MRSYRSRTGPLWTMIAASLSRGNQGIITLAAAVTVVLAFAECTLATTRTASSATERPAPPLAESTKTTSTGIDSEGPPWELFIVLATAIGPVVAGGITAWVANNTLRKQLTSDRQSRLEERQHARIDLWMSRATTLQATARSVLLETQRESLIDERVWMLRDAALLLADPADLSRELASDPDKRRTALQNRLQLDEWNKAWNRWRERHSEATIYATEAIVLAPTPPSREAAAAVNEKLAALPRVLDDAVTQMFRADEHDPNASSKLLQEAQASLKSAQQALEVALRELEKNMAEMNANRSGEETAGFAAAPTHEVANQPRVSTHG